MPLTPFHIIAAAPIKKFFPNYFSWIWFSIVNILIDLEVIYYFLATGVPSHQFYHSLMGVTIIGIVCFIVGVLFNCKKIPLFVGCLLGSMSHYLLDGILYIEMNTIFYGLISSTYLHIICVVLFILGIKVFQNKV
jgi:hypothetical protein